MEKARTGVTHTSIKYWEVNNADWNVSAPHAMRMFSRPISAAECERVFSFLEGMKKE